MRQKALLAAFALVAVLLVGAPTAFANNLLTNGSFETNDLTGWTLGVHCPGQRFRFAGPYHPGAEQPVAAR
jgi:hypothetical protein